MRIQLSLVLSLLLAVAMPALADEAADRSALEATAQAWVKAFNARDADAMTQLTTDDSALLDANESPISGKAAAQRAWQPAVAGAKNQVVAATKEIAIAGNVAWRIAAFTHKLPNGEFAGRGQALEVWKRTGTVGSCIARCRRASSPSPGCFWTAVPGKAPGRIDDPA